MGGPIPNWINTPRNYCLTPGANLSQRLLVRMAYDAMNTIGTSNAKFLTPPVNDPLDQMGPNGWEYLYLSYGGWRYANVLSAHAYLQGKTVQDVCCDANNSVVGLTVNTRKAFFPIPYPPIFFTEGGYGSNPHIPSDDAAWIGAYYTLILSSGTAANVANLDWYAYDIKANLWEGPPNNVLTEAGTALGVMQQDWGYDGATFDAAGCAEITCGNGNRWTCNLTEGGGSGTQAQVAWYDGAVNDDSCSYSPGGNPPWVDYRDLSGDPPTGYNGQLVPLTNRPILFEHGPGH